MVDLAHFIGIPYRINGRGDNGIDCAGLVMEFYRHDMGVELPALLYGDAVTREEMASLAENGMASGRWEAVETPDRGDVLVFRMYGQPTHVGVYIGDGDFLHSVEGKDSCIERLDDWRSRLVRVLRWNR